MKISLIGKIPTRDGFNNFRENSKVREEVMKEKTCPAAHEKFL